MSKSDFLKRARQLADFFSFIISHRDSDGVTAAALLKLFYNHLDVKFYKRLNAEIISNLSEAVVFSDIGAGFESEIGNLNNGSIILDHHETKCDKPFMLNPRLFNFNPLELSGAGTVYFFLKEKGFYVKKFAYLALVGAIGDSQERGKFIGLNKMILDDAVSFGNLEAKKSLRTFGDETKSLASLLEQSADIFIPGVSGNYSGAFNLLKELSINPDSFIDSLSSVEIKKLEDAIIALRKNEKDPKDIYGFKYTLLSEPLGSPFRNLKEFSTTLNSYAKQGLAEKALLICLGDEKQKNESKKDILIYRKKMSSLFSWFYSNKDSFVQGEGYIVIDGCSKFSPEEMGTLVSFLSRSRDFLDGMVFVALSEDSGELKVSLRRSGNGESLYNILKEFSENSGGHHNAAGAIMPLELKNSFILRLIERITKNR